MSWGRGTGVHRVLRKLSLRTTPTKWQRENVALDAQSPFFAVNLVPLYIDKGFHVAPTPPPLVDIRTGAVVCEGTTAPAATPDLDVARIVSSTEATMTDQSAQAKFEFLLRMMERSGALGRGDAWSKAEAVLTQMSHMEGCGGDLQKLCEHWKGGHMWTCHCKCGKFFRL